MSDAKINGVAPMPPGGPAAMVRLAAAMAVQDAAAHMRNTQSIANAAIGMAQQLLLRGQSGAAAQEAMTAAQNAVTAATANFVGVSEAAADILTRFPGEAL